MKKVKVEILDYGINNVSSICNSLLDFENVELSVRHEPNFSQEPDLIILPGVGHFRKAVERFNTSGIADYLKHQNQQGIKILGICLGMQLLGKSSEEAPGLMGLNLVNKITKRIPFSNLYKIPNVGWNTIRVSPNNSIFASASSRDFYFTHSYFMEPTNSDEISLVSRIGDFDFQAGFKQKNIIGLQFHPEKSSFAGENLLREILMWAENEN